MVTKVKDRQLSEIDIAFKKIGLLVKDFHSNESHYKSSKYSEAEARKDFIDKYWIALGWDVNHEKQNNPYEQEVKVERGVTAGGSQRRADYAFYLAPNFHDVRFFVEAKKPSVEIESKDNYFQLIRYSWNSETPLAVLTDFEQLHILDCRYKPNIETALSRSLAKYNYTDYANLDKFSEIYWLFSRESVADGSIEKRVKDLPKPRGKAIKLGPLPGGYQSIDESFLSELDDYRNSLARNFKNQNPKLDSETLTELAQRTLDRLVFLRFLEDKGIEAERLIEHFGEKNTVWEDFVSASHRLDSIYNGIVYKQHDILDSVKFRVDENAFAGICKDLAHINSPYDFNAIPIHILGSIYERFLGKVIVATEKRVKVEEKPEVRKAGGVYYTPEYIVRYIVENTVGKLIVGKTPNQIAEMRFADIACGSGSFLLGVFDLLLNYHGHYYNDNPNKIRKGDCIKHDGKFYLSLQKKREILLNNIYGVDIDAQAVEVCQLSLYLKLLQEETEASAHQYLLDFEKQALLPSLSKNIVCGNSLIGTDILEGQLFPRDAETKLNAMNFEDAFPEVMKSGGFDAIVGNPPYIDIIGIPPFQRDYFGRKYSTFLYRSDILGVFFERAIKSLAPNGRLGFITSNTYFSSASASKLRKFMLSNLSIEKILDIGGGVFTGANVDTAIFIAAKGQQGKTNKIELAACKSVAQFQSLSEGSSESSYTVLQSEFGSKTDAAFVVATSATVDRLVDRIRHSAVILLRDVLELSRGYIAYDAHRGHSKKMIMARVFHSNKKLSNEYKKELVGSDIGRYCLRVSSKLWIQFGDNLAAPRNPRFHHGPRIWIQRIRNPKLPQRLVCFYTDKHEDLVASSGLSVARTTNPEYSAEGLCGVLNSRFINWWYRQIYHDVNIKPADIETIPLPSGWPDIQPQMVVLVEHIQEAKKQLAQAKSDKDKTYYENKCASLDRQIDCLVYDLYGLTKEEIEIVEGAIAKKTQHLKEK